MILEGKWKTSSQERPNTENRDLLEIAGQWASGITVTVSNPASYSLGPVEHHFTGSEPAHPERTIRPIRTNWSTVRHPSEGIQGDVG